MAVSDERGMDVDIDVETGGVVETRELDLLSTIRALIPNLSKSHKRVAEMVLADPHWTMQSSVDDLASRSGVGKPTIVRFTRSVGCEGLRDFKLRLAGSLALGANYLHRAVHASDEASEVVNNVVGSTLSAIADWHRGLRPDRLARAADILNRSKRIDCYGTGQMSHFIALDLQARFFRLGVVSYAYSDAYLQLVAAATLTPEDAVVAISFTGRLPNQLEAVRVAKAQGAKIISVTRDGTPMALLADVVLPVDVPADATMPVGTDGCITQILMIELITIMVGRLRGPGCERRLERIHRLMQTREQDIDASSVVYWDWEKSGNP
jgi:RpiR family transcriptional regulator, carbohydrate utilization regulator